MLIRKCVYGFYLCALALGVIGATSHTSYAEKITPNQVYRVTEDILAQLNRMHESNMTVPSLFDLNLNIPERKPRHVIQQALNVHNKIQVLKRINGLKENKAPILPIKEITPEDVNSTVEALLMELVEFDAPYGLDAFKKNAPAPEGKTPKDVYINLLRAEAMILQLGIPDTIPNEVYSTALAVSEEVKRIAVATGKKTEVEAPSASFGKKPADAYSLAYYALKGLQGLSKKKEFTIPGGVELPKRKIRKITSADVQQLLLFCLAELSSMKVTVGSKEPLGPLKSSAGQTPSTVVDQLGLVNRQIQAMQW